MAAEMRTLFNRLPAVAAALQAQGQIQKALDDARDWITQDMASKSPPSAPGQTPAIDTGELVGSLTVQNVSSTHGELSADGGHAIYLEYGTYKMAPRPFLAPAAEQIAGELPKGVVERIEKAAG